MSIWLAQGELTLLKRIRLPGAQRVYNMTVEEEHVYHVSLLGALVHNNKNCFPPGTLVLMADRSTKRIEEVRQGDLVLSADPEVGTPPRPGRVSATIKDWTQCLVHIAIGPADGVASERELVATRWHPVWTKNRKWQNAVDIQPGDTLQDDRGAGIRVLSARQEWRISDSYNFSVPGLHTYFVVIGGTPILVHNADPPLPPGASPSATVIGVPDESAVVTLWKAPAPGRLGLADEVVNGFAPSRYPGNGPYFATDKTIALEFRSSYNNGLQEINIPRSVFDQLVQKGVIKVDGLYQRGRSWRVPPRGLGEFNEAIKLGPPNAFHS